MSKANIVSSLVVRAADEKPEWVPAMLTLLNKNFVPVRLVASGKDTSPGGDSPQGFVGEYALFTTTSFASMSGKNFSADDTVTKLAAFLKAKKLDILYESYQGKIAICVSNDIYSYNVDYIKS